jgi:hypothetical protein
VYQPNQTKRFSPNLNSRSVAAATISLSIVRRRPGAHRHQVLGEPTRLQQAPEPALAFRSIKRGIRLRPRIRRGQSGIVPGKSFIPYQSGRDDVCLTVPVDPRRLQLSAALRESG